MATALQFPFSNPVRNSARSSIMRVTLYANLIYSLPKKKSPSTKKYSIDNKLDLLQHKYSPTPFPNDSDYIRRENIAVQVQELKLFLDVLVEKKNTDKHVGVNNFIPGNVFLVGTGPGDPELLTLKAIRVIQKADLLLYDRLVSSDVLDLVGPHSKLLHVGKAAGYHSRTQEEIHELLLQFTEVGATIARLKGGDPLVFGRGGEEMDFLRKQGIHVKVIPGITAASGIAAGLGIPLTHRGVASSIRLLTGHSRKGLDFVSVAENAADIDSTLVVYMGLSTLPSLASKLILDGLPENTPTAAVERGTTPLQRTVFATPKGYCRRSFNGQVGFAYATHHRECGGTFTILVFLFLLH